MAPRKPKAWPPAILTAVPLADRKRGEGLIVADFIEQMCPQVKDSIGGHAGDPLHLRPWQHDLLGHLFAKRADGRYRHRTALVGLARKNGKSALGSGIALYGLLMGPKGGEVYSCAADRDQARIVFGSARAMVEASPELSEQVKLYRDAIEVPSTGSIYRVLSAEAFTKEGLSPTLTIYDELHAAPNDELFNVMTLAQGARTSPLTLGITTAGVRSDNTGQDSVCYRLYQHGMRVASGEVDDPSFFMAWWQGSEDADHRDPRSWPAANPGIGDLVDLEDFTSAVKRTPEAEFRIKRLNMWVNAARAWLPSGSWNALPMSDPVERDVPVVVGFDGSFNNDSTVLVGCTIEDTPRIFLIRAWERKPTDDDTWRVPIAEVMAEVMSLPGRYNLVELACDPYRWAREMQEWEDAGLPVVEYAATSPARMVPATAKFYDAVTDGGIAHDHDPLLARHIDHCVVKVDRLGPRIVKEHKSSSRKIDAAVAAVFAFDRATSRQAAPLPTPMFF
jgi:phage terminase large subunit-like protein